MQQKLCFFFAVYLSFISSAFSGAFSGVYTGNFSDNDSQSFVGLYVKSDNTATIFGVNNAHQVGAKIENISVNPVTGTFSYTEDGDVVSGTINKSVVFGSIQSGTITVGYSANKRYFPGTNSAQAGYYKGTFSGCGDIQFSGPMDAMITPSGEMLVYNEITSSNFSELIGAVDGGKYQLLGSDGTFNGLTVSGNYLNGTANGNAIQGSLSFGYTCSGSFSLNKVDVLQNYDIDSDGLNDEVDNCPNDANINQLDTDGDAEGDVCDLDDDNDNVSDEWEVANGSDPLLADSSGDIDNDGYTNLREYLASINPTLDTDNDGMFDEWEMDNDFNPDDSSDCPSWVCKPPLNTGWRSTIY